MEFPSLNQQPWMTLTCHGSKTPCSHWDGAVGELDEAGWKSRVLGGLRDPQGAENTGMRGGRIGNLG